MNLTTRLANYEDRPKLQRLIEASVYGLNSQDYSPIQLESALEFILGIDNHLIDDGTYYVAEVEGQLAGAGGWSKRKPLYGKNASHQSGSELLDPASDAAKIRAFYVHPNYARRGIGRRLMEACEDAAREAGFRSLELLSTLTGVPLYQTTGFEMIEPVELVLPNGVSLPTYKMIKSLYPTYVSVNASFPTISDV
jgi:GNAT superfamily N-acetyltransferase